MAEINVPNISQDDPIRDAAGKVLPESQQNNIRDQLKSSDLITEDGKASEDVSGVFQKTSSALSNIIGGDDDSKVQGEKFPVENVADGSFEAQPVSSKHSRDDSKFEDFVAQESTPKDSEVKDTSDEIKAAGDGKQSETQPEEHISQIPKHKDDVEQQDGSHAIGAVPEESASSDAQPKADDLELEKPNEQDSKVPESQPEENVPPSPSHKDDVEQVDSSHTIGAIPDESASSEAQPKDENPNVEEPSKKESAENSEKPKTEASDGEITVDKQPQPKTISEANDKPVDSEDKEESESSDQPSSQKVDDKENVISPKDIDGLKDDGEASAIAQPRIESSEKLETVDDETDVISTDNAELASASAADQPSYEDVTKETSVDGENVQPSIESSEKLETVDDEKDVISTDNAELDSAPAADQPSHEEATKETAVDKLEPESTDQPKSDNTSASKSEDVDSVLPESKQGPDSQETLDGNEESNEPEAKGEPKVDEESTAKNEYNVQPESKDGENKNVEPVENETPEPESKAKQSVEAPEEEPQSKVESVPEKDSKDEPIGQSQTVDDKEDNVSPKDLGELQDDGDPATNPQPIEDVHSPKRSSVHFDDESKAPANDDESKEKNTALLEKEEKPSPEPQSTEIESTESEKAIGKEDISLPKADTDTAATTGISTSDEESKGEAVNEKETDSEQTKDSINTPVEDIPQTSEDVTPKDTEELEGDGDASVNSVLDGTDLKSSQLAEKSEHDAVGAVEVPKEDELKSEGSKSEGSKSEELKNEELKSEELKSEEPKGEEPKSEEPKSDGAKSDELKSDDLKSDEQKDAGEKEAPTSSDTLAEYELAKDDNVEPKIDGQEAKQGEHGQDNDASQDDDIKESPSNEDKPADLSEQKPELLTDASTKDEQKPPIPDVDNSKDEGGSEIDLPERPKPETASEEPSDGSDKAPKGSLLDGVDPSTVESAEAKREVEPSHPEAQELPDTKQDSTPAQTSDAPKDSLLDGAQPSQVEEAEKYQTGDDKAPVESATDKNEVAPENTQTSQLLAPGEEYDDASMPEPTSDYEEVMGDDKEDSKYENPASSKESSKPSQTKQQNNLPLAGTLNSAAETIAATRKDLLDTATTTAKDVTTSVADGVKDNAPQTGKTYTESLTDMAKGVSDKAADLNQNYQDQATDGTKEGRQGILGLVDAAISYIPSFRSTSGVNTDKPKPKG
ncbi:hypothetical protein E2P81_ATG00198 [Venturia nashicola]|nr:hypothetical protein E2P81_ATG00198 [Venturia nashicola]